MTDIEEFSFMEKEVAILQGGLSDVLLFSDVQIKQQQRMSKKISLKSGPSSLPLFNSSLVVPVFVPDGRKQLCGENLWSFTELPS